MRPLRSRTVEGYFLTPCAYCGLTATDSDHVIPQAFRRMVEDWQRHIEDDIPNTLPACRECNSTAGDHIFPTVAAKRKFIHECYRKKYGKLLASPFWSESDINELGYELRSRITRSETQRLRLLLRLSWPYELEDEIEALTRYLFREAETSDALNLIRREEILR